METPVFHTKLCGFTCHGNTSISHQVLWIYLSWKHQYFTPSYVDLPVMETPVFHTKFCVYLSWKHQYFTPSFVDLPVMETPVFHTKFCGFICHGNTSISHQVLWIYLSWKHQYFTPSFVKNSKAALSRLFALAIVLLPSSHGRTRVGNPNGSAPAVTIEIF